jgi:putative ribosome biogenesis GTPase RsgA
MMDNVQNMTIILMYKTKKTKLHGLSPRANYADRATAACRRSDCQHFADRGCHVVSATNPYSRIPGFLESSRYFSIK